MAEELSYAAPKHGCTLPHQAMRSTEAPMPVQPGPLAYTQLTRKRACPSSEPGGGVNKKPGKPVPLTVVSSSGGAHLRVRLIPFIKKQRQEKIQQGVGAASYRKERYVLKSL